MVIRRELCLFVLYLFHNVSFDPLESEDVISIHRLTETLYIGELAFKNTRTAVSVYIDLETKFPFSLVLVSILLSQHRFLVTIAHMILDLLTMHVLVFIEERFPILHVPDLDEIVVA